MDNKKKYYYYFLAVIILFTIFRVWLSTYLGLGDDESYYWEWSRHLALGYFDHPPFIAYLIYIFTSIFGKTEIAVRLGSLILFIATSYLVYKISFEMFKDEQKAFYSVLLLNITPIFSAGAFMAFPDTPLGFFWVASIFVFYKIINENKSWLWYLGGVLVGLGLLSKYNAVLLPISILLFLILSKEHRFWLKRKEPYIACLIAFAIFFPVIIWNMNNQWASFGFQFKHGVGRNKSSIIENTVFLIISQFFYISPMLFIFSIYAIYLTWKLYKKENNINYLLLFCFAIPTMVLFNIAGIFKRTMPHWTALGFIAMFIALPAVINNIKRVKIYSIISIIFAVFLTGLIIAQTLYPILPLKPKFDVTNDLYGWPEAIEKVMQVKKQMPSDSFWLTHFHLVASEFAFYLPGNETVYNFNLNRKSQYDFWFNKAHIKNAIGKNAIYISTNHYNDNPEEYFVYDSIRQEEPLIIKRGNKFAKSFDIYRIYNFKGMK